MMQKHRKAAFDQKRGPLLAEQVGVCSSPDEDDDAALTGGRVRFVNEQEISADMTFAMARPCAFERVILPLRPKRCVIRDQQEHHCLQPVHVIAARAG